MESLHKILRLTEKDVVLASLSKFVPFLLALVADPNFKISSESLLVLQTLIYIAGKDIIPHTRLLLPMIVEKFGDSKSFVRSANHRALKQLMLVTTTRPVLEYWPVAMRHHNWMIREELMNVCIMVGARGVLDFRALSAQYGEDA